MTLSPCKPRSPSWRRSFDANLLSLPSRDRQPSPLLTQLDTRTDIIVKLKQMNAHSMAQQAPCRFSSRPQTRWSSLRWAQWTVEARLHPVSLLFHSGQVVADRLCVRRGGGGVDTHPAGVPRQAPWPIPLPAQDSGSRPPARLPASDARRRRLRPVLRGLPTRQSRSRGPPRPVTPSSPPLAPGRRDRGRLADGPHDVRPPVEDRRAQHRWARRHHHPAVRGLGHGRCSRGPRCSIRCWARTVLRRRAAAASNSRPATGRLRRVPPAPKSGRRRGSHASVDVDPGAALEAARQGRSVRVRAGERRHRKKKKGTSLRGRSFPTSAASWSAASFGRPSRWSC